ncbi:MAG: HDIG domain-containing metalloprotein [Candidatus Limnocylindrales bacterium]|jgi:putative nucleotidyltransferase with HDIG domain
MLREPHELPRPFGRRDAARLLIAAAVLVGGLAVGVAPDLAPTKNVLAAGMVASVAVRAPRDAVIENPVETDAAQQAAAAAVPPQYDYTTQGAATIARTQLAVLQLELAPVDNAFNTSKTPAALQAALQTALPSLPSDARSILVALDSTRWPTVEWDAEQLILSIEQGQEIRDPSDAPTLVAQAMPVELSDSEQQLVAALVTPLVVANSTYSQALTQQARTRAIASVAPVKDTFKAGQVIVDQNHLVTPAVMVDIIYFGLNSSRIDWGKPAAWLLLGGLIAALLLAWLWRYRPEYWLRGRTLVLIGLVFVLVALAEKLPAGRAWLPYLIPTAAAGMLLTVLLDAGMGAILLALLATLVGLVNGSSLELASYVFLGGLAGVVAIRNGERQHYFVQAALAVAAAEVVVLGVFTMLGQHDATGLLQLSIAAAGSALVATVLTLGSFALLGNLFGILTGSQLLELANPSQPLLRRLLVETPGTYHHSLMVGNLAERAAESIGADPLLARVAAFYHDVGKLANPLVFIENQQGGDNVHDQLDPEDSAAILRQHVADGVNLAQKARLPGPLIAFIPQHHGTSLIGFFYAKARAAAAAPFGGLDTKAGRAAAETVDINRFRHAGPKPQSREAAVLMLADGVEASVRSLSSRDEPTIRAMVAQIVGERLADGQLNECDLTIRDLENIREAFVRQLLGMYHQRIAYPQSKVVELESRRGRGLG